LSSPHARRQGDRRASSPELISRDARGNEKGRDSRDTLTSGQAG
jgi:hypothetical protein